MTSLLDPPADLDHLQPPDLSHLDQVEEEPSGDLPEEQETVSSAALGLATVSAALSSAGAAWMVGGMFRGMEARLVGFLGVLLGCGLVFLGTRLRSAVLPYLTLPASLLLGAVLMSSLSGAGTSSLPALVKDAATASQVLQPPIDFAPGWRMIVVVVMTLVASAATSMALSLGRTRIAVALPAPLTVVAALVQPDETAVVTGAVSVGFVMMGLATSYAADGVGDTFDVAFEARRLGRSLVAGVLLVGALVAASQVSFLFPEQDSHRVVPPRRPPVSPPQPDVPLYAVKGPLAGPLRVGVIDVYDLEEQAWLLPPVDNQRLQRLELPADLSTTPAPLGSPSTITVTVKEATGRGLPTVAGARRAEGDATVDLDPRTGGLSLAERPVFTGLSYSLTVDPAPTGRQLSEASNEVPQDIRPFLEVPTAPPAVRDLLAKAPESGYPRLQFVRTELYKRFIAAGQGKPTDVSVDRVVQLLSGGTGNPYELTATEALLARWAGIPSRIGFGYFNGETMADGSVEFRPANAATYLEVHVAPYGWVPVVGVPPRAQQSLSNNQRNNDVNIQASPELGINVYLPVRLPDGLPLYRYVQYYLVRGLPVAAAVGLLVLSYPVVLKRVRRRRREAWARDRGPAGAVALAYCELRDRMIDLALPGRTATPLELVELVAEDEEHAELAWLVTRGLWGDLRGRLGEPDAEAARRLADSVASRLAKAQPETARLLAAVSRASLRQPWSTEVPNAWFEPRPPRLRLPSPGRLVSRLRPAGATAVMILAVLTLGGCSSGAAGRAEPSIPFPSRLAPTALAGLVANEEAKAAEAYVQGAKDRDVIVSEGKVVSFSRNGLIQAALQVAQLKRGYVSDDPEVVSAITRSIGKVKRLPPQAGLDVYSLVDGSQRIYLWFPTVKSMALLVVRTQVSEGAAEALARVLVDYGQGAPLNERALEAAFAQPAVAPTAPPSAVPSASPTPEPTP